MTLKSNVRPMRLPPHTLPQGQNGKHSQLDLPTGWSINETNEILNEEGLVMMDVQEELSSEQLTQKTQSNQPQCPAQSGGTIPYQSSSTSHQLPPHISQLLDQLEIEEQALEQSKTRSDHLQSDESYHEPSSPEFITPTDLHNELSETLNPSSTPHHAIKQDQELKSWGKTGLDGLKNIFNSSSQSTSQKPNQAELISPRTCSTSSVKGASPKDSRPKKSVTFAPETYLPSSITKPAASSPQARDQPQPSPGIILSDIIEHPLPPPPPAYSIPSIKLVPPHSTVKPEVNGKNAHLNPRLASLLPRSLQNKQSLPSNQSICTETDLPAAEPESCESSEQEDGDDDDDSSTWSYEDYDEEGQDGKSWPPNDLDIQTALDLRQAALEYHTKRQGLGLGSGTGPLGGDGPPSVGDEEREWVPIDARVQAPGIPRESNGSSRFKAGRNLPSLGSNNQSGNPNDEKIIDGKLFGTQPIIDGPSPTIKGAAMYEMPGRKADFNELDDELTSEEVELLRSRLEILGMDEESRLAAERAGSELMVWMEKARRGELTHELLEEHNHHQPILQSSSPSSAVSSQSFSPNLTENQEMPYSIKVEGPPEVKTAPKSHLPLKSKLVQKNKFQSTSYSPHSDPPSLELNHSESDLLSTKNSEIAGIDPEHNYTSIQSKEQKELKNNHQFSSAATNLNSTTNNTNLPTIDNTDDNHSKITRKMSRFKSSKLNQKHL